MTVLHASDIHFGRPHRPEALEAVVRLAKKIEPEAVVISGDLTQRAKKREYQAARQFLAQLAPLPVVVVPGNHDVPLYRIHERIFTPYRNYRRYISPALDLVVDLHPSPGGATMPVSSKARNAARTATVSSSTSGPKEVSPRQHTVRSVPSASTRIVALNSSTPFTAIVNGRISGRQLRFAADAFQEAPIATTRILVVHHNLLTVPGCDVAPLRGGAWLLTQLADWGVDLVLSGHIHHAQSSLFPSGATADFPIVHAGTASSDRGREPEKGRNSVNLIRIENRQIVVTVYRFSRQAGTEGSLIGKAASEQAGLQKTGATQASATPTGEFLVASSYTYSRPAQPTKVRGADGGS